MIKAVLFDRVFHHKIIDEGGGDHDGKYNENPHNKSSFHVERVRD